MGNLQDRPVYWHGRATGSWWALGRDGAGRDRLVEAASQAALGRALNELAAPPAARPAVPAHAVQPAGGSGRPHPGRHARDGWLHGFGLTAPGSVR